MKSNGKMKPSGQGNLASIGQEASWNMPPGTGAGGTSTDMNTLHPKPSAGATKGHEKHLKEHQVVHAPDGNSHPDLTKPLGQRPKGY